MISILDTGLSLMMSWRSHRSFLFLCIWCWVFQSRSTPSPYHAHVNAIRIVPNTTTPKTNLGLSPRPPPRLSRQAVVVGAGPAGLAAALMLQQKHDYQVTILEASKSKADFLSFDPSRAYFYNINGRGQKLTKRFPAVQKVIEEGGVGITQFQRLTVPARIQDAFDPDQPFSRGLGEDILSKMGILYWIPRYLFIQMFLQLVEEQDNIQVCFGQECIGIQPAIEDEDDNVLRVDCLDGTHHIANLVVGADGPRSNVRNYLATQSTSTKFKGWKKYNPRDFQVRKWNSPSVGLRVKTLQLQPNFQIPVGGDSVDHDDSSENMNMIRTKSNITYSFQSINTKGHNALSLTLLPMQDSSAERPVVISTPPSHDLWNQKSGKQIKAWISNAFPRFNWNSSLVSDDEWERFAVSNGTQFPYCQYCKGLSIYKDEDDASSGICLVGDAIHAFPPDMGQGVNMALEDVAILDDCLSRTNNLGKALKQYQLQRQGETRAVTRMCRFAAPFQYGAYTIMMKAQKGLWLGNLLLRMTLNKLTRGLTPNPGIVAMMDPNMPFERIMKQADRLTLILWTVFISILTKVFIF